MVSARSVLLLSLAFTSVAVAGSGPTECRASACAIRGAFEGLTCSDLLEFEECTIAVVGAGASADGRPFLWKNRDTSFADNQVVYFDDGRYPYVALVNAGERQKVWIGVNLAGFAILNALSYNLADYAPSGITNGELMKSALQSCSGIDEFELLLEDTNGRRLNPSNLAVLDASGRAALFEAGGNSFVRYDADNPEHAPHGLMVRANFSLSADTLGLETWRFRRADGLLTPIAHGRGIRVEDLLRTARDLVSKEVDPYPLPYDGAPEGYPGAFGYVDTRETINRRSTSALGVIHGIRPGEHPAFTTFYAGLGQPVAAPVLPLWVAAGETPPEVCGDQTSELNDLTRTRGQALYNFTGNPFLMDTAGLVTEPDSMAALLPLVAQIESEVLSETAYHLASWRESCACPDILHKVEWAIASRVMSEYREARVREQRETAGVRISPHPNPSRAGVWFVVEPNGPPPDTWHIEIFDPSGRRVAEIRDPDLRPGDDITSRYLFWDGMGLDGSPLPGGIYFGRNSYPRSRRGVRLVRLP